LAALYRGILSVAGLAKLSLGSEVSLWGSALNLNLNPHVHALCPDGVYTLVNGKPRFKNFSPITDEEVASLIENISHRVLQYLKRKGYLNKDGEIVNHPMADELFSESGSLSAATTCSIAGKIAFGPNTGKYVTRIGSGFGYLEEIPLPRGRRCCSLNGFSLHANTSTNTHQRDKLRDLIECIARGPLSNERLEIIENQKVKLKLKSPWSDGTTHLLFTFSEFLEKLVALIPPPKTHLVRWAGCFAPNSPLRKQITLKPDGKKGFQLEQETPTSVRNYAWSRMLAHVFKIDVTKCECGGEMRAIGSIMNRDSIVKYLRHVGIDYDPPQRAPPKLRQESFDFDQDITTEEYELVIYRD